MSSLLPTGGHGPIRLLNSWWSPLKTAIILDLKESTIDSPSFPVSITSYLGSPSASSLSAAWLYRIQALPQKAQLVKNKGKSGFPARCLIHLSIGKLWFFFPSAFLFFKGRKVLTSGLICYKMSLRPHIQNCFFPDSS